MRNLIFANEGVYHICNRGVDKREVFADQKDYERFLINLVLFNTVGEVAGNTSRYDLSKAFTNIPNNPLVKIHAFVLLPNHFHFILRQKTDRSMEFFLRSLATRYSMFFNKKYNRIGKLFQGHYKAILIDNERYLLYLSKYIHKNPKEYTDMLTDAYSSYSEYLDLRHTSWIETETILSYFKEQKNSLLKKTNSYKSFVEDEDETETALLGNLIIEK